MKPAIIYCYDAYCGWCYGFGPVIKKITAAFVAVFVFNSASAQLTVAGATPVLMVDTLLGTGVTASGVTYTGDLTSTGTFNGAFSNIGFTSGAMLTTGDITVAPGPNAFGGSSAGGSGAVCTDAQLNAISTTTLYDGAVLEFDFIPTSDTLKFRYVFASEEYPEYVCSNFNDVFGFFISGPNPAGGSYFYEVKNISNSLQTNIIVPAYTNISIVVK